MCQAADGQFFEKKKKKTEGERKRTDYVQIRNTLIAKAVPCSQECLYNTVSLLVSWCFEPSQPQRITSGLELVS